MSRHVVWMLDMQVAPGRQAELRALMHEMATATEANEPGTLDYEWSLSDDGTTCHLFERYRDCAAAEIHIATFGEQYAARFMELLTPTRVMLTGAPNDAIRAALAPIGAVYLAPAAGFSRP
jgi:quinol monooxygenase YgiN